MAKEATTLPSGEGEAKPEEGQGAITSEGSESQDTKKPKEGEPATPEKIAELEGQVEDLTKKIKQANDLQSQADIKAKREKKEREKLEATLKKIRDGEISAEDLGETPLEEDGEVAAEKAKARIGIQNLFIGNHEYNQLLDGDITLREVVKNNPLALIGDFYDSADAIAQFKQKIDERIEELKKKPQPKTEDNKNKEGEEGGPEFEAGPTQPAEGTPSTTTEETKEPEVGVDKVVESIKGKIEIV